jgi:hypothetical protein
MSDHDDRVSQAMSLIGQAEQLEPEAFALVDAVYEQGQQDYANGLAYEQELDERIGWLEQSADELDEYRQDLAHAEQQAARDAENREPSNDEIKRAVYGLDADERAEEMSRVRDAVDLSDRKLREAWIDARMEASSTPNQSRAWRRLVDVLLEDDG